MSLRPLVVALLAFVACGPETRVEPALLGGTEAELTTPSEPEPLVSIEATAAPADTSPSLAGEPPALDSLLRLPPARAATTDSDDPLARPEPAEEEDEQPPNATKLPPSLRPVYESRTDESAVRPEKARKRTDAGVELDVGETTSVRGGVRVEQEAGKQREDPVPTVGIEARF
jgi:hypothetical protein